MELSVVEQSEGKMKIEVKGETETLTHVIAKEVWEQRGEGAAIREHPFLVEPKIVVHGKNPVKILEKSADSLLKKIGEIEEEFKKELKKS